MEFVPTGLIRRIDDLGRIVISKEIRRKLDWKECELFELFVTKDDQVVIQRCENQDD